MLQAVPFANAVTVIVAVFYVVCVLLSYIAPDFIFSLANSWIHSMNLEALRVKTQLSFGTLLYGFFSIAILTWLTTYATITLYNRWAK